MGGGGGGRGVAYFLNFPGGAVVFFIISGRQRSEFQTIKTGLNCWQVEFEFIIFLGLYFKQLFAYRQEGEELKQYMTQVRDTVNKMQFLFLYRKLIFKIPYS